MSVLWGHGTKTRGSLSCTLHVGAVIIAAGNAAAADPPLLSAWYTTNAGQIAKVVEYTGGSPVQVWPSSGFPNMGGGVSTPTRSDIQQIRYSTNNVYVNANGLASHIMGPWYLNSNIFGNWPSNQNYTFRFPRNPVEQTGTRTTVGGGNVGLFVNGVGMFNGLDAYSYKNSTGQDVQNGPNPGDGIWHRNAIAAEVATFDKAYAHQPPSGTYHYHASPLGLRFQLNDNILESGAGYAESTSTKTHSPILGFALDGFPVYGPYGYSDAMNTGSVVTRMRTGYTLRNGTFGTTNLTSTGRHSLPAWSAAIYGFPINLAANQYGPNVSVGKPLGWYAEDFDYLGDLGYTQGTDFDLNKYNVRFCKTPEYPAGTYCYFTTIEASGAPAYPYALGGQYFGVVSGSSNATVSEATTTYYIYTAPGATVGEWVNY